MYVLVVLCMHVCVHVCWECCVCVCVECSICVCVCWECCVCRWGRNHRRKTDINTIADLSTIMPGCHSCSSEERRPDADGKMLNSGQ